MNLWKRVRGGRRSIWIAVFLSLVVFRLSSPSLAEAELLSDSIQVIDKSAGCFHSLNSSHVFERKGNVYVYKGKKISAAQLDSVRSLILQAPTDKSAVLDSLGITREFLAHNRPKLIEAALGDHWKRPNGMLPAIRDDADAMLSYERLAPALLDDIVGDNNRWSTTRVEFQVVLPGSPIIIIGSSNERPGMMPFTAKIGNETRRIYSPDVGQALQQFANTDGPNYSLLDARKFWQEKGWSDSIIRKVGIQLDACLSERVYKSMDGFGAVKDKFRIERAMSGYINQEPLSVHLDITVCGENTINRIWCWIHLSDSAKPTTDWNAIDQLYMRAEQCAKQHRWLHDWRASGKSRDIELQISGTNAHTGNKLVEQAIPAWRAADLPGTPRYLFLLRENDQWKGTLWLSDDGKAAVLTNFQGEGCPWANGREFSYPNCGYATYDGRFETFKVSK